MKGNYALVLHLPQARKLTVGKRGSFLFTPGYYLYFGSAQYSLVGRLRHHLQQEKKIHWHIDYLSAETTIEQVWWAVGDSRQECAWTRSALKCPEVTIPIKGFGSSDCRECPSHLVHVPNVSNVDSLARLVASDLPEGVTRSSPIVADIVEQMAEVAAQE